jgi:hypothetical protein
MKKGEIFTVILGDGRLVGMKVTTVGRRSYGVIDLAFKVDFKRISIKTGKAFGSDAKIYNEMNKQDVCDLIAEGKMGFLSVASVMAIKQETLDAFLQPLYVSLTDPKHTEGDKQSVRNMLGGPVSDAIVSLYKTKDNAEI